MGQKGGPQVPSSPLEDCSPLCLLWSEMVGQLTLPLALNLEQDTSPPSMLSSGAAPHLCTGLPSGIFCIRTLFPFSTAIRSIHSYFIGVCFFFISLTFLFTRPSC